MESNGKPMEVEEEEKSNPNPTSSEPKPDSIKISKECFVGFVQGTLSENYDAVRKIGKGGYGSVYEVKSKKTGEIRACKHLSKMNISNLEKFKREISFLIRTDHYNIIKLYEVYETERSLYLIMEECKGGELFDRIVNHIEDKKMYTEKDAAEIMLQVMSAIEYCHSNGICHRDLKPENLLYLNEGGEEGNPIKVIDFGLSQVIQREKKLKSKVGTAYYVAPEILKAVYNEKCDVWSAGVILYVLLSGDPPFNGPNDNVIYYQVSRMKYSFPENKWSNISEQAKDLISLMLKPEEQRLSASQVLSHPWFNIAKGLSTSSIYFDTSFFKEYKDYTMLKKIVLLFVATRLKEEEIHDLNKLFMVFDKDRNGTISYQELKEGIIKTSKENIEEKEIKEIFDAIDTDKNGRIDYTEFIAATLTKQTYLQERRLFEAFTAIDTENTGKITKEQLIKALKLKEENVAGVEDIIKKADKNNDGYIDYKAFLDLMGFKKEEEGGNP